MNTDAVDLRGVGIPIICTIPEPVHVGDSFSLRVVLFNYSPNAIRVEGASPSCSNPLSVEFDKNVAYIPGPLFIRCEPATPHTIGSGQVIDLFPLPSYGVESFIASAAGETNTRFSLVYSELSSNSSLPRSISETYAFTILPQ